MKRLEKDFKREEKKRIVRGSICLRSPTMPPYWDLKPQGKVHILRNLHWKDIVS